MRMLKEKMMKTSATITANINIIISPVSNCKNTWKKMKMISLMLYAKMRT
jgi:hypothetical protein